VEQVDGVELVPLLLRRIHEIGLVAEIIADIVDQHVEPAEALLHGRDEPGDIRSLAHVRRDHEVLDLGGFQR
jgi:hypothetical protein